MGGKRKIFVFLLCLVAAMIGNIYMSLEVYKVFLDNLVFLAAAFFASNVVSNVGYNILPKIRNKPETPPGGGI